MNQAMPIPFEGAVQQANRVEGDLRIEYVDQSTFEEAAQQFGVFKEWKVFSMSCSYPVDIVSLVLWSAHWGLSFDRSDYHRHHPSYCNDHSLSRYPSMQVLSLAWAYLIVEVRQDLSAFPLNFFSLYSCCLYHKLKLIFGLSLLWKGLFFYKLTFSAFNATIHVMQVFAES